MSIGFKDWLWDPKRTPFPLEMTCKKPGNDLKKRGWKELPMQNSKELLMQDRHPLGPANPLRSSGASAAQEALNERLHLAISQGEALSVAALLDQGADLRWACPDNLEPAECLPLESAGCLPLEAAGYGHEEICRLLLSRGADPNQDAHLPLAAAASEGHEAICRLLLAQGAAINAESDSGFSALLCAVESGSLPLVQLLLEHGADPNASADFLPETLYPGRDLGSSARSGRSAGSGRGLSGSGRELSCLMVAAFLGHAEICRLLIAGGAGLETRGPLGFTPLAFAAQLGREAACQVLLSAGASPNAVDSHEGDTPLLLAASGGHMRVCGLLLLNGAKMDARNHAGETAEALALARQDTDLLTLLSLCQSDFGEVEAGREGQMPDTGMNPSAFAFCPRCGSALPTESEVPGGAAFCPKCGTSLNTPPASPSSSSYSSSTYNSSTYNSYSSSRYTAPPPRQASSSLLGSLSHVDYSRVFFQFEAAGKSELKGMWVKALVFTVVSLLLVGVTGGLSAFAAWVYYGFFGNWDLYLWEKYGKQGW